MLSSETFQAHVAVLAEAAAQCHAAVNQTYDGYLPYAFHLRLTASYALRFLPLLQLDEAQGETVLAAAYFHDTLEDARLSYNDLTALLTRLKDEHQLRLDVRAAAEAVYALTNDKGRTRAERAGDAYYQGIRETPFAPFLKMCDRLANLRYSTLWTPRQRMARVYAEEMPHFLKNIGQVPEEMVREAERLLSE